MTLQGRKILAPLSLSRNKTAGSYHIETISDFDRFEELGPVWQTLLADTQGDRDVFNEHRWLESFWKTHANTELRPLVVVLYEADRLISAWPLQISRKAGLSVLQWLSQPIAQYGGPLIAHDQDVDSICWRVVEHLGKLNVADVFQLSGLLADAPYTVALSNLCEQVSVAQSFSLNTGAYANWDAYHASQKKSARRARRKRFHKFNRAGDVSFDIIQFSPDATKGMLTALQWKREWLVENRIPNAALEGNRFEDFLKSVLASDVHNAVWVVGVLSLDSKPVAIEIGAHQKDYYASFLSAYDKSHAKFSVGKIQLELMIKWAVENNISTFDLLVNEGQYKGDWTDTQRNVLQLALPFTATGRVFSSLWLKRLRPAAKLGLEKLGHKKRRMLLDLLPGMGFGNQPG